LALARVMVKIDEKYNFRLFPVIGDYSGIIGKLPQKGFGSFFL